jgi:hypothetical protein
MSAHQSILDHPASHPAGPALPPALRDAIGGYHREVGPSATHWVAAAKRFAKTRLLEVTAWGLLVAWWVALASLVLKFMPLATVP